MIHLNNVTKVYPNGSTGVEGINLHIKKGEFVFIVGSSGSGKSTLMKLLLKELDPTEGDIIINRIKTNDLSRKQIPYLRRNLGVVFQDFAAGNMDVAGFVQAMTQVCAQYYAG